MKDIYKKIITISVLSTSLTFGANANSGAQAGNKLIDKEQIKFTTELKFDEIDFFTDENKTINVQIGIRYDTSKPISVKLYKTNKDASLSSTYFKMNDRGILPDKTDQDGIFTVNATLSETKPGTHCYRVSVEYNKDKYLSEVKCVNILKHITQADIQKMIPKRDDKTKIDTKKLKQKMTITKNTSIGFINFNPKSINKSCLKDKVEKLIKVIEDYREAQMLFQKISKEYYVKKNEKIREKIERQSKEILRQRHIPRIGDGHWERLVNSKYLVIENKNKSIYLIYSTEHMQFFTLEKPFKITENSKEYEKVYNYDLRHWIDMKECIKF